MSLSLVENGLVTYVEMFDGADTGAALERFEEIGAQSEPERLVARVCRLVDARDWGGLADCYADDYELVDRRALGWEPLSGPDAIVGMFRSWTEMAPDLANRFEVLALDGETHASRFGAYGHAADGGGALEYVNIAVGRVRDGRALGDELFDDGDEAAALARFEELRRRERPGGPRRRPRASCSTASSAPTTRATGTPLRERLRAGSALHRPAAGRLG